jgi:hypothetical protein
MDRFVEDLKGEVKFRTGYEDPVVFYNRKDQNAGQTWRPEMGRAMSSTVVGLVLTSPSYFRSSFAEAELAALQRAGASLLPVEWIPVDPEVAPYALRNMRWMQSKEGQGLRYLARVEQGREYRESLFALAADIAQRHSEAIARALASSDRETVSVSESPLAVIVTVLAERKDVMRVARPEVVNYGLRRQDWIPFPAEGVGPPAWQLVLEAAKEVNVEVRMASLHGFDRWLRHNPKGRASLALVDPWTLKRAEYRDRLSKWRQEGVPQTLIACLDVPAADQVLAEAQLPSVVHVRSLDELRVQLRYRLTLLRDAALQQGPDLSRVFEPEPPLLPGPGKSSA